MSDINNGSRYLFRGKRIDNGEWVEGNLINKISPHEVENVFWCSLIHDGALTAVEVYPSTVGQWTGLVDKNGVRVFDGDVVFSGNWNPSTYKVAFDRGAFYLSDQNNKEGIPEIFGSVDAKYIDKFEIICNIHDNPDLLKP